MTPLVAKLTNFDKKDNKNTHEGLTSRISFGIVVQLISY